MGTLFFAGAAQAALITTQSSTAPTTDVLISQTASSHTSPWRTESGLRQVGQSFLVGAGGFVLDKITVNINTLANSDLDGDSFTLTINTYTDGTDFTPDSTVSTQAGNLPANLSIDFGSGDTYLTFDIDNVTLTGGQQYGFFLDPTGFSSSTNLLLESMAASSYTSGIGLMHGPAELEVWDPTNGVQNADLEFYLQEVPEPSTFALAAFGLLGLIGFGRRRR